MNYKPYIFGCQGTELSQEEFTFFSDSRPFGFILFKRNCEDPLQITYLVEHLKATQPDRNPHILIDQEGGRVARLKGNAWPNFPAQRHFGLLYRENPQEAIEKAIENAYTIGRLLIELGINVNCSPLLDVLTDKTHNVIGDRAFSEDPEIVFELGCAYIEGYLKAGIQPIVKHLPGHGRATFDSHETLPIVDASAKDLQHSDFLPFSKIAQKYPAIWGMTAHILYSSLDADNPASLSTDIIQTVIRSEIGFKGLLMSDDISMKAITGSFKSRAQRVLQSGCDLVLHCNGDLDEMKELILEI